MTKFTHQAIFHPNVDDYPNQRIFIVNINDYAYVIPTAENEQEYFLKTIILSRKLTKRYPRGDL
jgi:hypothetical protein